MSSSRLASLVAVAIFLPLLFLPGVYHFARGLRASDLTRWAGFVRAEPLGEAMRLIDEDFDRRFLLRFVATALTENLPAVRGRVADTGIQSGVDGFLFATEDSQVATASGFLHPSFPKPKIAADQIVAFDGFLKSRGVHLVVVPVPAKVTVYPEKLNSRYDLSAGPFTNVDNERWFAYLRSHGVDALDVTQVLWSARDGGGLLFYPADTHWTDRAKQVACAAIASHLGARLAGMKSVTPFERVSTPRTIMGNLVEPTDGALPSPPYREEVVQLRYAVQPDFSRSPVVLLGDSQAAVGYESGAGFPQRLVEALNTDVNNLSLAGAGPNEMRMLLLNNPAALERARVVIWVFSNRHLLIKPWDPVTFPALATPTTTAPGPG